MSTIHLSERTMEVVSRWSEVHVRKLSEYFHDEKKHGTEEYREYLYTDTHFTVSVQNVPRCMHKEELVRCPGGHCDSVVWIPRVMMQLNSSFKDLFFSLDVPNDLSIPLIYQKFQEHQGKKTMCACGRIPKKNFFSNEQPQCDECYIYGFVRGEDCSICMEDDGKPWVKTSCGHHFHESCWYNIPSEDQVRKCPLCRSKQNYGTVVRL